MARITFGKKDGYLLDAELVQKTSDLVLCDRQALGSLRDWPSKTIWLLLHDPIDQERQKRGCRRARDT